MLTPGWASTVRRSRSARVSWTRRSAGARRMATYSRRRAHVAQLRGRTGELGVLGRFIETVRAGESRVLVVRGEPGVGKTALLEYLVERAAGCRIAQAAGAEPERDAPRPAFRRPGTRSRRSAPPRRRPAPGGRPPRRRRAWQRPGRPSRRPYPARPEPRTARPSLRRYGPATSPGTGGTPDTNHQ